MTRHRAGPRYDHPHGSLAQRAALATLRAAAETHQIIAAIDDIPITPGPNALRVLKSLERRRYVKLVQADDETRYSLWRITLAGLAFAREHGYGA